MRATTLPIPTSEGWFLLRSLKLKLTLDVFCDSKTFVFKAGAFLLKVNNKRDIIF